MYCWHIVMYCSRIGYIYEGHPPTHIGGVVFPSIISTVLQFAFMYFKNTNYTVHFPLFSSKVGKCSVWL
jgi:hypothetical protein